MLDIYQRETETTRPGFYYSQGLKRSRDVSLIAGENGEVFELVEIEIGDNDEYTSFFTIIGCPPVFISLRPADPGEDPEICLSVPDDEPGIYAEQLAAAQLESALSAVESAAPFFRESLRQQFGLYELGQPGAGPRALRPAARDPVGSVSVRIRFADGTKEEYTLSQNCPALCIDATKSTMALALSPALWAADLFFSAAETWQGCSTKTRKRLCAEYGIDMRQFLKRE